MVFFEEGLIKRGHRPGKAAVLVIRACGSEDALRGGKRGGRGKEKFLFWFQYCSNRKERFRFRFLENGSDGSGSSCQFLEKRLRRFRFPVPVWFLWHPVSTVFLRSQSSTLLLGGGGRYFLVP